jgi:formylglycine-generating enzyme required for sulfatase activity
MMSTSTRLFPSQALPSHPDEPTDFPAPWASDWGEDEYGLWMSFSYRGIRQALRWIPPGTFLMGSPEDESERWEDETQHRVILTQGFWLAETPCTQALWQAVMGDNPSQFPGVDRPVETVSWDDAQAFLTRCNNMAPELALRLPTEAEWEYACRAGTTTPFWFGSQITPEQVNYHGNYPYAGGEKGQYRGETVSVYALPCNAWGLYQMHGNVWEWCQDWYALYAAAAADTAAEMLGTTAEPAAVDPVGPAAGDDRVLRGGSWIYHGWLARSAQRYAYRPGRRDDDLGFRLARGQASPAGRAPEAPAGSGVRRAGQTQRSAVGQARRAPRRSRA